LRISPILSDLILDLSAIFPPFATERPWANNFRGFASRSGLIRTQFTLVPFQPFHFSFADEALGAPMVPPLPLEPPIPISFAVTIANFEADGPWELSVKEGQTVYVFDVLVKQDWACIRASEDSGIGFVPATTLKLIDAEIAVMRLAQISPCPLKAGTFLLVKRREGGFVICEDIHGNEKIVAERYLQ
jgi:hypothetical protein